MICLIGVVLGVSLMAAGFVTEHAKGVKLGSIIALSSVAVAILVLIFFPVRYSSEVSFHETKYLAPLSQVGIQSSENVFLRVSKESYYITNTFTYAVVQNSAITAETQNLDWKDVEIQYISEDEQPCLQEYVRYAEDNVLRSWFTLDFTSSDEKNTKPTTTPFAFQRILL